MAPNNYIVDGERVSADVYNKAKYEDLRVRVPKGKKDAIKAHAEAQGESVNGFINRAIDQVMAQDRRKSSQSAPELTERAGVVSLALRAGEGPGNGPEWRGGVAHGD